MFEFLPPQVRLRGSPRLSERDVRRLATDFETFRDALPHPVERYVLDTYGINLASVYGGHPVKNPFGKASGQLSLALHQIEKDAAAGLGFVVLKTVIAQDQLGDQTMRDWAIPETRMLVERIRGRSGNSGWTITWKGRGWFDTFAAYCQLFDQALIAANPYGMLIVPSVKYHLPMPTETLWKEEEYNFTTTKLMETWSIHRGNEAMPLEKDFSPTLAGSAHAAQQAKILEWLHTVPRLIHRAAPGKVTAGLKLFNALFDDDFQLQMLEAVHAALPGDDRADFLIYANRLFDPHRAFEGKEGVAYGGPDLSDRNLAVLERFLSARVGEAGRPPGFPLPLSATGDIHCGRIAAEYLLRGASSFQMHTLFQLTDGEFEMRCGNKTEKALHRLLFHPVEGFLAWVLDLRERLGFSREANVQDVANWCRTNWTVVVESLGSRRAE
jgi:hypothetical protein